MRLDGRQLAAAVMQVGGQVMDQPLTLRMLELLGERQGLLTPVEGLLWIAQGPECGRRIRQARHLRRDALVERLAALNCQVDEGNALREVAPGRGILTEIEQSLPQRVMGRQEMCRHRLTLGQAVEFFSQL